MPSNFYLIKETLVPSTLENIQSAQTPYVANVTQNEFKQYRALWRIDTEFDLDFNRVNVTKAEMNDDSLTGCFSIPSRDSIEIPASQFSFALDDHGIVFIDDDSGKAQAIINRIRLKKWQYPSLELFLHDFLEGIIYGDLTAIEKFELEMDAMEDRIIAGNIDGIMTRLSDIRSELSDLRTHYSQLAELGQQFEYNEDGIFNPDNVYYFRLFVDKVNRLQDVISSLREHTHQVRDLYQTQLDVRQNRNMTMLTVIATIFTPLTLITGWYGMNFVYMPELQSRWSYPILIIICIFIVLGSIIYFKRNKWL